MASLIGALRATLSADTAKFEAGMKRSARTAQTSAASINKSLGVIKAGFTGFAAGLSVGLLTKAIKGALEYAGSLGETAQQLGVTTKELQNFRFAAGQNGASVEEADKALGKFSLSISKARSGSEEAKKAFKAVGVELSDLESKSKTEILGKIADKMKATGGASNNAAAGVAIFGKGFQKIIPTLDLGSAGMSELSDAAERLGIVLSDEQIQNADRTADKLDALKTVLASQFSSVVAANADSIIGLAQSLSTLTVEIIKFLGAHPETALAIIGGIAGSRFGLPGAAVGAVGGALAGEHLRQSADDANTNLEFRRRKLHEARDELNARRSFDQSGGIIRFRRGSGEGGDIRSAQAEFDKQLRLANSAAAGAIASANRPKAGSPPALPQFLAPSGAKTAKRAPRDRSDDTLFQFDQEQRRADIDILHAKQDLSHSTAERAAIGLKILDLEQQAQDAELDNRVNRAKQDYADGRITKDALDEVTAQAAILKEKNAQVTSLEKQSLIEDRDEQLRREANDILDHENSIRQDILQKQIGIAETANERRKLELELLQVTYDQKKRALQDIIDHSKDAVEIANARADLAALGANFALDRAAALQNTRGPMEDFLASLPTSADKANEALQNLEVEGFNGFIDSVLALSDGVHSATESLLTSLKNFLLGLARLELQRTLGQGLQGSGFLSFLGNIFGTATSGFNYASANSNPGAFLVNIGDSPYMGAGFAAGGFTGNISPNKFAGFVHGGEGVLNTRGLAAVGISNLNALNRGVPLSAITSNDNGSFRAASVNMTVITPDADSFRRSAGQTTRALKRKLA